MSDTTSLDGNDIDAVAANLIAMPPEEDETADEALVQAEADAQNQADADEADTEEVQAADEDEGDEGDADAEDDEPAERLYTVKVNGREQQVPLHELLRGYSGQAYIQENMQRVAQAKQETEQLAAVLQSERQQLMQFMQAAQTGQIPMQPPAPPNEALLQTDPIGYLEARVKYDKEVAAYQQTQMALQELQARNAQAQEQSRMAYLAEQHRQLAQIIPAFAKPETAAKIKQELISAGTDVYGYTPDELRAVSDHRALRVLHDAAQYRRLMAGKTAADKSAPQRAPQTPTLKPGAKQQPTQGKTKRVEQAKAQMKRTGSVDDVARFLLM